MNIGNYTDEAKCVFTIEAKAVMGLGQYLDDNFSNSIEAILNSSGRVIICGMGKSGIIGSKIAATLASTGTPSFFMHPGEAYHGDLGMVTAEDVFIAISNSGETNEVTKLIPFLVDNGNFLIAVTGNPSSTLAKSAHTHLNVCVEEEACPLQLAPTASTTATLAMGDALAVTLMKARNFKAEHFARFHPGGALGRRLLRKVEDEMVRANLPFVIGESKVLDIIHTISQGSLGVAVVHEKGLIGIITDGDIRRAIETFGETVFDKKAQDLMSTNPASVVVGTRVEDALIMMEEKRITTLLVVKNQIVVGIFKK